MLNTIKNHVIRLIFYALYFVSKLKVALGLLKMKHGIIGYFEHAGVPCSTYVHKKETFEALNEFDDIRPDDVVLCTYPKAGSHFIRDLILSIDAEKGSTKHNACPIEMTLPKFAVGRSEGSKTGIFADIEAASSPRILWTHLPWNLLPEKIRSANVKMVHCVRNPKDVLCSFYPFLKAVKVLDSQVSWEEFVYSFIDGNVVHGGYFSYLKQWYPHRNKPNALKLQFEDMMKDLEGNVRRIAEFLNVELTQEQIDRIVVANTFENKKKEVGNGHFIYRRGKSGGWKSDITVEQNEMLDEWIEREMEDMPDLKLRYD